MIIRVERSGGLTGIMTSRQMNVDDLPLHLIKTVKKMMSDKNIPSPPMKRTPMGAADYCVYKIIVDDGSKRHVINCDDYNMQEDLKSLVRYVQKTQKRK